MFVNVPAAWLGRRSHACASPAVGSFSFRQREDERQPRRAPACDPTGRPVGGRSPRPLERCALAGESRVRESETLARSPETSLLISRKIPRVGSQSDLMLHLKKFCYFFLNQDGDRLPPPTTGTYSVIFHTLCTHSRENPFCISHRSVFCDTPSLRRRDKLGCGDASAGVAGQQWGCGPLTVHAAGTRRQERGEDLKSNRVGAWVF